VALENVDWEDTRDPVSPLEGWPLAQRALERRLAELGATDARRDLDLKEGRCLFVDAEGVVLAEARAQLLGTWLVGTERLVMAWADPVVAPLPIARLEEMGDMLDVDVATARELILRANVGSGAEHVLVVDGPIGEHFVALRALRGTSTSEGASQGSPVATVLRGLGELRRSVAARHEPTDVLRSQFLRLGKNIGALAAGPFRGSEWVGRLERAAKVLQRLGGRLVPPTFTAIAAGRPADEWLSPAVARELADALALLEDEWSAFH
jgi:hypothetical protein